MPIILSLFLKPNSTSCREQSRLFHQQHLPAFPEQLAPRAKHRIEVLKIVRESGRVPIHDRYVIQDNKVVLDLPGD